MLTAIENNVKTTEKLFQPLVKAGRREPFSIFLVDDDTIFLKSMEHHLQHKLKNNIKIATFPNGEECVKNLDQNPDVVILDFFLNDQYPSAMNGVSVLKKIKQVKPEVIAIMVSGQDKMQVAVETMKYGAFDYVIKNENAFLRVQNAVKNAIHNIMITRELKNYKRWMRVILGILAGAFATVIVIQVFFPHYFHLAE
ncbi:MAG: response regulator [Bacteroidetes bacterium]|nr:response regulator [Bacteroidota bacterium]